MDFCLSVCPLTFEENHLCSKFRRRCEQHFGLTNPHQRKSQQTNTQQNNQYVIKTKAMRSQKISTAKLLALVLSASPIMGYQTVSNRPFIKPFGITEVDSSMSSFGNQNKSQQTEETSQHMTLESGRTKLYIILKLHATRKSKMLQNIW